MNKSEELKLLSECEERSHTGIAGKQRFLKLAEILGREKLEPKSILDVGGTLGTALWFQSKFPNATITILNKTEGDLKDWPNTLAASADSFDTPHAFDFLCGRD